MYVYFFHSRPLYSIPVQFIGYSRNLYFINDRLIHQDSRPEKYSKKNYINTFLHFDNI